MKKIKIALLGAGTVGSGVIHVLRENAKEISERIGAAVEIKTVLVRDRQKNRPQLEGIAVTENFDDILRDDEIKIVAEVMGGIEPARGCMLSAMRAKKSVVTANKDVVAEFGMEMFDEAAANGVDFLFEASVGGGIPIILPLKECLTANKISEIMGIVNGTTNYMLTKMSEDGADFDTVLAEAQAKGYAEKDPTADVDGLDAARKAAILASLAFNARISFGDVAVEGIRKITPLDIEYAKELGYVIKLLAVGKKNDAGVETRVHPALLPTEHPLASVNGVYNAIFIRGNAIGEAMFYGRGAGSLPTASAVVADIAEAARDFLSGSFGRIGHTYSENVKLCPIEETESGYYVRLLVDDKPGVLGAIATAFGDCMVSLQSVMQTKRSIPDHAEIVGITHSVAHKKMLAAVKKLKTLAVVDDIKNIIRVESMNNADDAEQ